MTLAVGRSVVTVIAVVVLTATVARATATPSRTLGAIDRSCNGGHGLYEPVHHGILNDVLVTETTRDVTVVAFGTTNAAGTAIVDPTEIYAVTPNCSLDRQFGTGGFVTPHLPSPEATANISLLASGLAGRFFVLSCDQRSYWIGEFNSNGTIDGAFGTRGWVSIISPGIKMQGSGPSVGNAVQQHDGTIILTGDVISPRGDTQSYIYALHSNGRPDRAFGHRGMVTFNPGMGWAPSAATDTLVQPDGAIAEIGYFGGFNDLGGEGSGGPGCFHVSIEWLTQRGAAQRAIGTRYIRQRSIALTAGFVGSDFIDASAGVGLIGEASPCKGDAQYGRPFSAVESLTPSGLLDQRFGQHGESRFSIPDETSGIAFSAIRLPDGHVILESLSSQYYLQDFSADGRVLNTFANRGVLEINPPASVSASWTNLNRGARGDFVVVVPTRHGIVMSERIG